MLTAIDELPGLRPTERARGKPSGITYRRGFTTRARSESCSTSVWSGGASPETSSRAPTIPSTMRSEYQYEPKPTSSPPKPKTSATLRPSIHQPSAPSAAHSPSRSPQAFRTLRIAGQAPRNV